MSEAESVPTTTILDDLEREMTRMQNEYGNQQTRNRDLSEAVLRLIRVCRIQNEQIRDLWVMVETEPTA